MQKNTKTYLLLALVLVIWGTIGYKIFSGLSPDPILETQTEFVRFKPIKTQERDTFTLVADYRDPFLGTLPVKKSTVRKTVPKPAPPQINIQYTGTMGGEGADRIFFVTIQGQQYLLKKGQQQGNVTLVNGNTSSITVRYEGRTQNIVLRQ